MRRGLSEQMLRHMQRAIAWDPQFARAHRRIADRYMADFEHRMADAANRLDITQIREAAMASSFRSKEDLHDWLKRAFGPNVELLQTALNHARRAVELCPLQGESYLHLADLCFLDRRPTGAVAEYVNQAILVRPFDKHVLTRAGLQQLLLGNAEAALEHWSRCFNTPGRHQKEIVYRLAGCRMPARLLLERMQPEWRTLREIWPPYRQLGTPQDLADLLAYASQATREETNKANGIRPATAWFWQATLHGDVGQADEALDCLNRAYKANPQHYAIRYSLGKALLSAGRLNEAESHVRWCLARRPDDKWLSEAIDSISRQRLAEFSAAPSASANDGVQQLRPSPEPGGQESTQSAPISR
jgi:tetratricopeptide (TPR) repeat protein